MSMQHLTTNFNSSKSASLSVDTLAIGFGNRRRVDGLLAKIAEEGARVELRFIKKTLFTTVYHDLRITGSRTLLRDVSSYLSYFDAKQK